MAGVTRSWLCGSGHEVVSLSSDQASEAAPPPKRGPNPGRAELSQSSPQACGVQPPGAPCAILGHEAHQGTRTPALPSLDLNPLQAPGLYRKKQSGCPGHPRSPWEALPWKGSAVVVLP